MYTRRYLLAAAGAVAIGSFLPWASIFGISAYGIQGDGVITLILAGAGIGLLLIGRPHRIRFARSTQATLALLATLTAGYHLGGFAAFGVYLTFAAACCWAGLAMFSGRAHALAATHEQPVA
jgi:hypothetical protein